MSLAAEQAVTVLDRATSLATEHTRVAYERTLMLVIVVGVAALVWVYREGIGA